MQVHQHRSGLFRLRAALARGVARIGFIGGSITDGSVDYNWPDALMAWLVDAFPAARFYVENAAMGATGSEWAVFRADRDLIDVGCDVVFVEYAVNDSGESPVKRRRTREGLIRKLLADGKRDVVLVYTFGQPMLDDMLHERVPASIADFEQIAEHYRLPSVWMGLHALNEQCRGLMSWEEWLPDGIHPQHRGSLSYAQSVIAMLRRELLEDANRQEILAGSHMPAPLDALNWQSAVRLPFERVIIHGPWMIRRWPFTQRVGQILYTSAVGATMEFSFTGRALVLGFDFGTLSCEFRYRLDGGEWAITKRERPGWVGRRGWFRLVTIAEELPPGEHTMEIEVLHGGRPDCAGTQFNLGLIGVVE